MITSADKPARLAIIGGGFTGAAFAIHMLKSASRPVAIDIVEPTPNLGRGAAYGTDDAVHRINVPSDRMSLFSDDSAHFTRWLFEHGWLPDAGSTIRSGGATSRAAPSAPMSAIIFSARAPSFGTGASFE